MGKVTDYLRDLIAKQVEEQGIVVWYDPEGHYAETVDTLTIAGTTVARYQNSFFALRHEIDPLLIQLDPSRLIVYVPLDPNQTAHALIEAEAAGVILKPGQQPPSRNTKLSVIARNALKPILGEETTATLERQVEAGKLTLAELEAIASQGEGISQGVLVTIFNSGNPQEIALEGRRRVKEQLKKMGSFEYHQTSFSYIDNETREEHYVGVPEEGGRNLISIDSLAPGSVYVATVDSQGKVGLYRLEVGCSTGTGKLKVAGGVDSTMKESIQRAFAYIQGHQVNLGIAQALATTDFHVEAIDLLTNRNKRHFLEVSADIMERVDPIFYSDPLTAAIKSLGLN